MEEEEINIEEIFLLAVAFFLIIALKSGKGRKEIGRLFQGRRFIELSQAEMKGHKRVSIVGRRKTHRRKF